MRKLNKSQNWQKNFQKYLLISFATQLFLLILSLGGIGYSIFNYLFRSIDTFQDLTVSAMFQPLYYSPDLVESFSQPIGPPLILYYRFLRFLIPSLNTEAIIEAPFAPVFLYLFFLFLISVFLVHKLTGSRAMTFLMCFSYPMLFLFGRGNPDNLCLILFMLTLVSLKKNRIAAAAIIGLLASIKLPFLVLIAIFVYRKEFRLQLIALLTLLISFLIPLLSTGYGILQQLRKFGQVTQSYFNDYVLNDGGNLFNNSLYGLLKSIVFIINGRRSFTADELEIFRQNVYSFASLIVYILILVPVSIFLIKNFKLIRNLHKFEVEVIFILILIFILTPQVSAEYRIVFLLPVVGVLYRSQSDFVKDKFLVVLFSLLLVPKEFLFITFQNNQFAPITVSTLLNPFILFLLLMRSLTILSKKSALVK